MKIQFGTRAMLLGTTFIAIYLGGVIAYWQRMVSANQQLPPYEMASFIAGAVPLTGPLWVPVLFATYALGRRAMTAKIVVAFAITEAASLAVFFLLSQ